MIPVKISSRNFPLTEGIESQVAQEVGKLERVSARILRCEVTLDVRHRHKRKGRIYHVQLRICLPKHDIFINREPELNPAHSSFPLALRDAFHVGKRRLEEEMEKRRAYLKAEKRQGATLPVQEDGQEEWEELAS